jgi:hypothetical protein
MIYNVPFKIKRNKHACIQMFLGVKGSEGACISELQASVGQPTTRQLTTR